MMPKSTATMDYFGKDTVEAAVTDYFKRMGLTDDVRDDLVLMAVTKEDEFFQMVDDFVFNNQ